MMDGFDQNGLPITGAGVDYSTVEPINQRELVTYINVFLVRTCTFLNSFATKCESKLAQLDSRLQSLDSSLTLLETKLNSVDEIKNLKLESDNKNENSNNNVEVKNNSIEITQGGPPPPPAPLQGQDPGINSSANPAPPIQIEAPVNTVSQDPRYIKYFKMLKLGVAEEAIKLKMKSEGVDPDFLNNPNAPAPPDDRPPQSSDSDNSDSD